MEDPKQRQVVDGMRQSNARMSELIDNIMDFARVRLGSGIGLSSQSVTDLNDPIERIVEEIRQSAHDHRFEIDDEADGAVELDLSRFEQILSNLLGNAVTHGDSLQPIRINCTIATDGLRLSICNAGTPISATARKHLFKPFLHDEVQRSQQGLGLGLYISSEIVRAHGSRLDVSSDETVTCFTVRIPSPAMLETD